MRKRGTLKLNMTAAFFLLPAFFFTIVYIFYSCCGCFSSKHTGLERDQSHFDLVYIMTEGGPNYSSDLMATYMYRLTFKSRQMGYGATVAVGMFLIITTFTYLFQYLINRNAKEE